MQTFQYRLYPTRQQHDLLIACLRETLLLYNEMLECNKVHYDQTGKFLFRNELCVRFAGRSGAYVPASTVQMLADRLDKSLRRYLEGKTKGEKVGFPRFKSANRWHSIQLRQHLADFRVSDDQRYFVVPNKLGRFIKIKLHRPLKGIVRTANLVLRADNHWYALIVCDTPSNSGATLIQESQLEGASEMIGLDVGLQSFLTDSNDSKVSNPRYLKHSLKTLRRKQRVLSRRLKGSRRQRKAARNVAKTYLKITRQRRDFFHKTAKPYAERYGTIVVEDLAVQQMVHHRQLARSILDAGWSTFLVILADKAASAGHEVIRVPAHYTSQNCSQCGQYVKKSLSVRTHRCSHCGFVANRDHNAALNILQAGAPPSGTVDTSSPDEPRSRCL